MCACDREARVKMCDLQCEGGLVSSLFVSVCTYVCTNMCAQHVVWFGLI